MDNMLAVVLCLAGIVQVTVGQRFGRWGGAFDRHRDSFSSMRSGVGRDDRQVIRVLDRGSFSDRLMSISRNSGTGSRSWGRGSQIAVEFDTRGRSQSRGSSRGFSRFGDSGFRDDVRGFRSSGGPSRSSFDSFNSRSSPDIIMISSRSQLADRRMRNDQGGQFTDIGRQSSSQPVIIRPRDQALSRSEFIRSSRPSHDNLMHVDPINSSSHISAPREQWKEMNVPQLNSGFDTRVSNQPTSPSLNNNPSPSTNTGTRSADIFSQISAHVNPAGSNTMSSQSTSSNITNKGPQSTVPNSISAAQAPASSSLQNVLMSLVGSLDVNSHRFPRPTEEPPELEELLMQKLMARVR
ncbi:uncharacterized protein LOC117315642 isoform X2 [Pecten maximus]|uniref:uncharacterized protein LOC117315642 isoform X2 n=1 Tax=Pecten maximus TaxID=6579 RepID=UPI001458128B|nr:uncharacterized protein LOC117315642 isoform X2 [Pecten maximus]